ncbi:hypothetical protein L207DRAFT_68813 [Hyaloscypha variabilis F]|uniref:Uncharacterized protein n=1 Tax=Hyaloscypha variabilis (strain UAMH 11265 / GT02V1 / F) TaxID=1149755 RepID=A0A2J6RIV0_HYAVF|nr:hypothetical protein L207DRAFT_68813 [Hyaloscypha variabilis F]
MALPAKATQFALEFHLAILGHNPSKMKCIPYRIFRTHNLILTLLSSKADDPLPTFQIPLILAAIPLNRKANNSLPMLQVSLALTPILPLMINKPLHRTTHTHALLSISLSPSLSILALSIPLLIFPNFLLSLHLPLAPQQLKMRLTSPSTRPRLLLRRLVARAAQTESRLRDLRRVVAGVGADARDAAAVRV